MDKQRLIAKYKQLNDQLRPTNRNIKYSDGYEERNDARKKNQRYNGRIVDEYRLDDKIDRDIRRNTEQTFFDEIRERTKEERNCEVDERDDEDKEYAKFQKHNKQAKACTIKVSPIDESIKKHAADGLNIDVLNKVRGSQYNFAFWNCYDEKMNSLYELYAEEAMDLLHRVDLDRQDLSFKSDYSSKIADNVRFPFIIMRPFVATGEIAGVIGQLFNLMKEGEILEFDIQAWLYIQCLAINGVNWIQDTNLMYLLFDLKMILFMDLFNSLLSVEIDYLELRAKFRIFDVIDEVWNKFITKDYAFQVEQDMVDISRNKLDEEKDDALNDLMTNILFKDNGGLLKVLKKALNETKDFNMVLDFKNVLSHYILLEETEDNVADIPTEWFMTTGYLNSSDKLKRRLTICKELSGKWDELECTLFFHRTENFLSLASAPCLNSVGKLWSHPRGKKCTVGAKYGYLRRVTDDQLWNIFESCKMTSTEIDILERVYTEKVEVIPDVKKAVKAKVKKEDVHASAYINKDWFGTTLDEEFGLANKVKGQVKARYNPEKKGFSLAQLKVEAYKKKELARANKNSVNLNIYRDVKKLSDFKPLGD